jgi:hypothetical protein
MRITTAKLLCSEAIFLVLLIVMLLYALLFKPKATALLQEIFEREAVQPVT